jgi:cell filamentation protein
MDDFYATGSDPYKDPATGVLRNKLGIADQASLDQAEIELVTPEILRLTLQATWGVKGHNFNDFCQLHREIFGQIYDWPAKSERHK